MNKRLLRASAATALALSVSLGAVAPAASAAPAKQPTRKAQTVKVAKPSKTTSTLVDAARRKVIAEISRYDAALAAVLTRPNVLALDPEALGRLTESVAGDRAILRGLIGQAQMASQLAELQRIDGVVRQFRPEVHYIVVGQIQDLAELVDTVEANTRELELVVADRSADEIAPVQAQLNEARVVNEAAALAITDARNDALSLSALSSRAQVQAATAEVERIAGALTQVEDRLLAIELALVPVTAPIAEPVVAPVV